MKKLLKVLKVTAIALEVALVAWGFACWIEIVCKNMQPNPQYSDWNIIVSSLEDAQVR